MKKLVSFLLISIFTLGSISAQKMGERKDGMNALIKALNKNPEAKEEVKSMSIGIEEAIEIAFMDEETEKQRINDKSKIPPTAGQLSALYGFPDGYYIMGLSNYGTKYIDGVAHIFGPAYYVEGAYWKNLSQNATSYKWWMLDPEVIYDSSLEENGLFFTDEEVPALSYPMTHDIPTMFGYASPILTASSRTEEDQYTYGIESFYNESEEVPANSLFYMYLGGQPLGVVGQDVVTYGITNCDHYNFEFATTRILNARDSEVNFFFGSNMGTQDLTADGQYYIVEACAEVFTKPLHPYILESVRLCLTRFQIIEGTELELIIHRYVDNQPVDTIARCSWIAEEDIFPQDGELGSMRYLKFDEFIIKGADGKEVEASELIISDAILVEFKGYNDGYGLNQIALADQAGESWDGVSTAYIYRSISDKEGNITERVLKNTDEVGIGKNHLL